MTARVIPSLFISNVQSGVADCVSGPELATSNDSFISVQGEKRTNAPGGSRSGVVRGLHSALISPWPAYQGTLRIHTAMTIWQEQGWVTNFDPEKTGVLSWIHTYVGQVPQVPHRKAELGDEQFDPPRNTYSPVRLSFHVSLLHRGWCHC